MYYLKWLNLVSVTQGTNVKVYVSVAI